MCCVREHFLIYTVIAVRIVICCLSWMLSMICGYVKFGKFFFNILVKLEKKLLIVNVIEFLLSRQ